MKSNPILRTLKENDIVLFQVASNSGMHKEICKISNLRFIEANEKISFDWLDYDAIVLYTNTKLHKSQLNESIGNCYAITQRIDENHLEQFARVNDMWKADTYLLTDEELDAEINFLESQLGIFNN